MIIYDFYIVGVAVMPLKAQPPLAIDPNTELPLPVAAQFLKSVGRGRAQIVQIFCAMQIDKPPQRCSLHIRRKLS